MIRVGFHYYFSKNSWLGGAVYLKNLFEGINVHKNINIQPVIITDYNCAEKDLSDFKNTEVIKSNLFSRSNFNRILNKILIIFFGKNIFVENFLKKNKINITSHFSFLGNKSVIPSIYWQPDFQEIHNPNLLKIKRILFRKINIFLFSRHSDKILLSSNAVRSDLKRISLQGYKKSEVIQPVFSDLSNNRLKSLNFLIKKFKIKKRFFFLPNHFWVHKNHLLVLQALIFLKKRKKLKNIQVVCTGLFNDYRYPDHKDKILKIIKDHDLKDNFRILGVVKYIELISLMKYSLAVINPSKSEGWSSTVEQAKSLGKFVLLSNLKVHQEQRPERYFFFDINDYSSLSAKMINIYKTFSHKKESFFNKKAINKTIKAKSSFILDYTKLVKKVLSSKIKDH